MVNRRTPIINLSCVGCVVLNLSKGRYHVQSKWIPVAWYQLLIEPLDISRCIDKMNSDKLGEKNPEKFKKENYLEKN